MWLVLLLIAILPLKQHSFWTGYGGEFTPAKYLGAVCVGYAIIYLMMRSRPPRYLVTWQARCYLLYVLLMYISFALSGNDWNPVLGVTSLLLLYFILTSVVDSIRRLHWVVLTTVASLAWASLYVIREWQMNHGWATGYRGAWVVGDENHFAVSAICAIPLAWYMTQERTVRWERWLLQGCMLLTILATLLAASRGGLLGLVAAMLFAAIRSRKRTRNIVAVFVLLVGFNFTYSRSPLQRMLHPNHSDTESDYNHYASWQAGVGMIEKHPLLGVGLGTFKSKMNDYKPDWYQGRGFVAHSAYISIAAETGVPALFLFLGTLVATYVSLERIYRMRSAPPVLRRTALGLQAALVGNAVSIAFISAEYHEHLWFAVFLSMCLPPLATRFARRPARTAPGEDRTLDPVGVTAIA